MAELYLTYSTTETIVESEHDEPGEYGWSQSERNFTPHHLTRTKPTTHYEWYQIEVADDLLKKDHLWMVVVRYTDGCTFGSTSGYFKIIDCVVDRTYADELERQIRAGEYETYYTWNGKEQKALNEWEGYFASLDDVEIHGMEVRA